VYDPEAMFNAERELPEVEYAKTLSDAVTGADLVCVLTAWDEFRYLDPSALADVVASQRIIDAMNCLDAPQWINAGWEYRGMGRSVTPALGATD
jgi:UDPglucose 6-dehydrogenase